MPEGHTIHRIARDHQLWFAGQRVSVLSPQGRFSVAAAQLNNKKLQAVTAHGKHLFYHWNRNRIVHIHLGLYGKFRIFQNPAPDPRGAVRVRLVGKEQSFDLNGPNQCEIISQAEMKRLQSRLGQDPLREDSIPLKAWERIRNSRAPIGTLLLDQSVIAGIGNIYRAEILFLSRIHPSRPGKDLSFEEFDRVWNLSVELLELGVRHNRIITRKAAVRIGVRSASRVQKADRFNVYKVEHCLECGKRISRWTLANRTIYSCSQCQE